MVNILSNKNRAILFPALYLIFMVAGAYSACTPSDPEETYAPGETMNLQNDPPNSSWSYLWVVKESDVNGKVVLQETGPAISFKVPETGYPGRYYVDLLVTSGPCVDETCKLFQIETPTGCSINTNRQTTVYLRDQNIFRYYTRSTPSGFNQRWWIFPEDKFPKSPSKISYQGHQNYRIGDGNTISVVWWNIAQNHGPGKYIVSTGYYDQSPPYRYRGSCQLVIIVMDRLSVDISLVQEDAPEELPAA